MNSLAIIDEDFDPTTETDASALIEVERTGWQLQKLSPKHQQALALVAQGMKKVDVARLVGYTPEYITMLLRQPLAKEYLSKMCETVGVQLEAMFVQTVEVIGDALKNGTTGDKLKAARLQLEATKRLGKGDGASTSTVDPNERLIALSGRLVDLLAEKKAAQAATIIDGEFTQIPNS